MTRSEIIKALSRKFPEIDSTDTENVVRLIFKEMKNALAKGRRIEIRNFGVIYPRTRGYALYRNPRTGEPIIKEPIKMVGFKEGKSLKNSMRLTECVK